MKIFGHPLHLILAGPTLGILGACSVLDLCYWFTENSAFLPAILWLLGFSLLLSLATMTTGLLDYLKLFQKELGENKVRLKIASFHLTVMLTTVSFNALSFFLRWKNADAPHLVASVFLYIGAALLPLGGWLGGELVLRYRMGTLEDDKS
jgi:uncharacterized membrane protein